jgi:WD40 repeat protein
VVSVDDKGNTGGKVYVHDVTGTGLPALTTAVPKEPWSITVSPRAAVDGSVAVAVGTYYSSVTLLTLTDTALTVSPTVLNARVTTPNSPVDVVRFSPDGTVFAEGDDYGALRMWRYPITSTTPFGDSITFAGGDSINDIAFTPSGAYVAVGGAFFTGQLGIYDATTQTEAARAPTPTANIKSLAFSATGAALIAGEDDCGIILVCN